MAFTACGEEKPAKKAVDSVEKLSTKGDAKTEDSSSDTLVILSPNSEDMINVIIPLFEKETGIKVELLSLGTGELFKRIESEQGNPSADVVWSGGRATYYNNNDLFEGYTAKDNDAVIEEFQNDTDRITLNCLDGSCLLVNKDLTEGMDIKGYADILSPELKGKISGGDPASSSSAFAQLTNQLVAMGSDYTSQEGWDYVKDLITNMECKVTSGSQTVHKSVYPTEGSVYLPAGSGIIKDAKNMENAKIFMDFIVSQKAQDALFSNEFMI